MSHSPVNENDNADTYLDNWNGLASRIRNLQSLSGRERNCFFLNSGQDWFADVSAAANLHFADDGRGLAFCDWDQDGDIDLWTANRTGPRIRFLKNNLPATRNYIAVQLEGDTCNRDAIGARVEVVMKNSSRRNIKTLRAGEGFLSQSSKWLHFGLGRESEIENIEVRWPGSSIVETFSNVQPNQRYQLKQATGTARPVAARPKIDLPHADLPIQMPTGEGRTLLTQRVNVGDVRWRDFDSNAKQSASNQATLVTIWASWCPTCQTELKLWNEANLNGVQVVALCVDEIDTESGDLKRAKQIAASHSNVEFGIATPQLLRQLTELHNQILYRQRSLAVPCSFLIDQHGKLAAIYKGPVEVQQLQHDITLLDGTSQQIAQAAAPFGGIDVKHLLTPHALNIANTYLEGDYLDDAERTLKDYLSQRQGTLRLAEFRSVYRLMAQIGHRKNDTDKEAAALLQLAKVSLDDFQHQFQIAERLAKLQRNDDAKKILAAQVSRDLQADEFDRIGRFSLQAKWFGLSQRAFTQAIKRDSKKVASKFGLAMAFQMDQRTTEAIAAYQQIIEQAPQLHSAANNLAWLLATTDDSKLRDPVKAVQIAIKICEATKNQDVTFLDTLAVAYEANEQFDLALQTIDQALLLASKSNQAETITKLNKRRAEIANRVSK